MYLDEDIKNFMETLVEEEFSAQSLNKAYDHEYLQDLFCITLNQLKPHYVRNTIDVRINFTSTERSDISKKIAVAINEGHRILNSGRRSAERD
jgi:hypothetical protein